jgi:hypothetical protein
MGVALIDGLDCRCEWMGSDLISGVFFSRRPGRRRLLGRFLVSHGFLRSLPQACWLDQNFLVAFRCVSILALPGIAVKEVKSRERANSHSQGVRPGDRYDR